MIKGLFIYVYMKWQIGQLNWFLSSGLSFFYVGLLLKKLLLP